MTDSKIIVKVVLKADERAVKLYTKIFMFKKWQNFTLFKS